MLVLITQEGISQLESCKFIPLMYQLAARMSSKNLSSDTFQEVLQEVIKSEHITKLSLFKGGGEIEMSKLVGCSFKSWYTKNLTSKGKMPTM